MGIRSQTPGLGLFFSCLLVLSGVSLAHAQKKEPKAPEVLPTIEFSAVQLGQFEIPELFYAVMAAGPDGKPKQDLRPLSVANGARGGGVRIPLVRPLAIYTKGNGGKAEPYIEIPARAGGEKFLLLFYMDRQGQPQRILVDDSAAAHPPGTVRVMNLSAGRIAFSAGGSSMPVGVGGNVLAEPVLNADGRFPFIHYEERPGQEPYTAPTKLLRFRQPGQRLLVVQTMMPAEVTTGEQRSDGSNVTQKTFAAEACFLLDRVAAVEGPKAAAVRPAAPGGDVRASAGSAERELVALAIAGAVPEGAKLVVETGSAPLQEALSGGRLSRLRLPSGAAASFRVEGVAGASGSLGAAGNQLLVLAPGSESGAAIGTTVLDNSLQSHAIGGIRILNLTPYQLAFSIGKEVQYVNPKENQILPAPPGAEPFGLKLAVKAAGGWKLVTNTTQNRPGEGKRSLLVVYKEPGKEEFSILEKVQ